MKTWLLKHKMLLYFFAIFGAILVITDMLSWIGFLFQNLYKIPVDDRKVSLLGDMVVSRFFRKFISSASKYRNQIYGFSSSFGCSISILNRCSMSI